jgi:hypothetical protein
LYMLYCFISSFFLTCFFYFHFLHSFLPSFLLSLSSFIYLFLRFLFFCSLFYIFSVLPSYFVEPEWRSRYSDWLRAGRPRGRSSSPGRTKNFLFSKSSRPALGSTQPPIQ